MDYVTVPARIHKKLKELLDKYNIKPGPVIRRALEEEVKKKIIEELEAVSKELSMELVGINDEEIAVFIRRDREDR